MKKLTPVSLLFAVAILFFTGCKPKEESDGPAPVVDMKDFFKNGEKSTLRISPDGNFLSYRADYKGKMNIYVQKTGDSDAVRVTSDTARSIGGYFWKGDRIVYGQDIGGDENFQVFSVKADGSDLKALTPFPGYRSDLWMTCGISPARKKK
ncbi:MAG: hypothetical protein ABIN67_24695 [Ferruginibacter sp.]